MSKHVGAIRSVNLAVAHSAQAIGMGALGLRIQSMVFVVDSLGDLSDSIDEVGEEKILKSISLMKEGLVDI